MAIIPHPRWASRLARDERGKLKHHAVDFAPLDLKAGKGLPRIGGRAWGVPFTLALRGHGNRYKVKEKAKGFELEIGSTIAFEESDQLLLPTGEVWTPECGMLKTTLVLDKKPQTNAWAFDLAFPAGTVFAWQPPLTPQEAAEGCFRPDWCVGSFAVFDAGGAKIAHMPRPFARDADGAWTWADLTLAGAVLTVTVPQAFLDAARYPVTVDPTFGYTSIGGSSQTGSPNYVVVYGPWQAATAGNAASVSMYGHVNGGGNLTLGFYSGADPYALQGDSAGAAASSTQAWNTQNLDSPVAIAAATNYKPASNATGTFSIRYDTHASLNGAYKSSAYSHGTLPANPSGFTVGWTLKQFSIYVTYTPAAAAKAPWHLFWQRAI